MLSDSEQGTMMGLCKHGTEIPTAIFGSAERLSDFKAGVYIMKLGPAFRQ